MRKQISDNVIQRLPKYYRYLQELLDRNGFPADYLEPIFTCKLCKDTGYDENQKKCTCLNQKIIKKLYAQSYIQRFLETENFNSFDFTYYSKEEEEKLERIFL